jgi:hypothetical protein
MLWCAWLLVVSRSQAPCCMAAAGSIAYVYALVCLCCCCFTGTLEITFQPDFADAEAAVLSLLDTCLQAVAGIPRQGTSGSSFGVLSGATVAAAGPNPASVPTTLASEAAVQQAYQEIQGILAANRQAPQQLVALLEPFLHLLEVAPADYAERFATTATTTENGNPQPVPDLAKYAEEIDRLQQAAAAVRMACTDNVRTGGCWGRGPAAGAAASQGSVNKTQNPASHGTTLPLFVQGSGHNPGHACARSALEAVTVHAALGLLTQHSTLVCAVVSPSAGLYYVRCRAFKEQLCAAADATVQELLGVVAATTRDTNEGVYSQYQVMTAELGRDSGNGEEVLALKKHIAKCNLDSERLKGLIDASKRRDDLLFRYRWVVVAC